MTQFKNAFLEEYTHFIPEDFEMWRTGGCNPPFVISSKYGSLPFSFSLVVKRRSITTMIFNTYSNKPLVKSSYFNGPVTGEFDVQHLFEEAIELLEETHKNYFIS